MPVRADEVLDVRPPARSCVHPRSASNWRMAPCTSTSPPEISSRPSLSFVSILRHPPTHNDVSASQNAILFIPCLPAHICSERSQTIPLYSPRVAIGRGG